MSPLDGNDICRAIAEALAVIARPKSIGCDKSTGLIGFRPQPHRRFSRFAASRLSLKTHSCGLDQIRFHGGKQLSPVQSKRKKGAEIAERAGDLTLPLCDHIAMIVLGKWLFEFDGKAIPDPLIIWDPQFGPFPDFRPLAAVQSRLLSTCSETEFQGSIAAVSDLALEFD